MVRYRRSRYLFERRQTCLVRTVGELLRLQPGCGGNRGYLPYKTEQFECIEWFKKDRSVMLGIDQRCEFRVPVM